jgi:hypothetical protein
MSTSANTSAAPAHSVPVTHGRPPHVQRGTPCTSFTEKSEKETFSSGVVRSPHRKLRCLRGAYHASRSVAQLLYFLLEPSAASGSQTTLRGSCPITGELAQLSQSLEGTARSLQHEGPLGDTHLIAIRDLATDAAVTHLRENVFNGDLCPRTTASPTSHLWTPTNIHAYREALLDARQARLNAGAAFNCYHHLREAGEIARHTFCDTSNTICDPKELRASEEWRRLIRDYTAFLPDRSHIHELENLPQEVAIGELLCDTVASVQRATAAAPEGSAGAAFALDCVVDVGGGNGFLAAQVAERLHCDGAVIDPFFPAHSIDCCPRVWPDTPHRRHAAMRRRQTLHRTKALFRDVRWADVVPAAPSRSALIAKHLCGSGVDEVLTRLEAQGCLPRILVLAPCCFHRCSLATYVDATFVGDLLSLHSEAAFHHLTRLTDWNASVYQRLQDGATSSNAPDKPAHVSKRSVRHLISCPEGIAAAVEAVVNQGRVQWLQQRGYVVQLVEYVPNCVTPKNRCIVAYRPTSGE